MDRLFKERRLLVLIRPAPLMPAMAQGRVFYFLGMAIYSKPFLDVPDQIVLLKSRGLEITDEEAAENCLRRIGYYRLSAYWYPFRVLTGAPPIRTDTFLAGSRLEDAVNLYVFDKKLKMQTMDAIERVEIAMRVALCLCLGRQGAFSYLDPARLNMDFSSRPNRAGQTPFALWTAKMATLHGQSNEEFVRHFNRSYQPPMPIWMAAELWDFGMMSWLYSGLKVRDKQQIATDFGLPNWSILQSWLRALNSVRNIAAHHARLRNRVLVDYPTLPRHGTLPAFDALQWLPNSDKRVYAILCVLAHLLSVINPNSNWKQRVVALSNSFPTMPHAKLSDMGFSPNWKTHSFWN